MTGLIPPNLRNNAPIACICTYIYIYIYIEIEICVHGGMQDVYHQPDHVLNCLSHSRRACHSTELCSVNTIVKTSGPYFRSLLRSYLEVQGSYNRATIVVIIHL